MNILITGSQGFICSYVCNDLLSFGHNVVGIDNYSKYGKIVRSHDSHPNFKLYQEDVTKLDLYPLLEKHSIDIVISACALIGGISFFHQMPFDLLADNEQMTGNTFKSVIKAWQAGVLKRIIVMSSSMVYESATQFPVKEDDVSKIPPPLSSYGFQKLATEYYAKAAYEQYGLPYTIIRPFNAIGIGEDKAIACSDITSGNIKLTLSHVLPDLIIKVLAGQDPLHILGDGKQIRCFTHGKDIARGIRLAMMSDKAINEAFNISSPVPTPIVQLADLVWRKIRNNDNFRFVSDKPFKYDVRERIPDTTKAWDVLGFKIKISLEEAVDEVIDYVKKSI